MMREVAARQIADAGYFRGVCPIYEPGERITDSEGICPRGTAAMRTNVRLSLLDFFPGKLRGGLPAFLMRRRETPGTVCSD